MLAVVSAYTRLLVACACGTTWLEEFNTPMRTLPFRPFTALPSVTGHCVAPVFAAVIVIGVVGQNASCPVVETVRTLTRSPTTRVRGSTVSAPRSNHWFDTAG